MISLNNTEKINGVIYMIINCINGKKYIGRDSRNNPNYLGGGVHLAKAQKKYGRKNFIKIILRRCNTTADIIKWEQYYLDLYNVGKNKRLYNKETRSVSGGVKRGIKVYQYDADGNYLRRYRNIKQASLSYNVGIESIRSAVIREGSSCGYFWSFTKVDKLLISGKKAVDNRIKPVFMYDKSGLFVKGFATIDEAACFINRSPSYVGCVLRGKKKSAAGYYFSFDKYDVLPNDFLLSHDVRVKTPYYYNKNGSYAGKFASVAEAAKFFGVNVSSIYTAIDRPWSICRNYYWSLTKYKSYPLTYRIQGESMRRQKYLNMGKKYQEVAA